MENPGLGSTLTMHEESVRMLMFIYWNILKVNQAKTEVLKTSTSVFPTILDLAGLPIPEYLPGKSLLPVLRDPYVRIHRWVAGESVGVR